MVYIHQNGVMEETVALNIKNAEVERLAAEVAEMAGESKTEAVRRALEERRRRLRLQAPGRVRRERMREFLEGEVWSRVPRRQLAKMPDKAERESILGYGPDGV